MALASSFGFRPTRIRREASDGPRSHVLPWWRCALHPRRDPRYLARAVPGLAQVADRKLQAARRSASTLLNQSPIWFQLANVRLTGSSNLNRQHHVGTPSTRFWHRHARLHIHIVIDHDFPFAAVFLQDLQQTSTKPSVRVHLCARWRSGFRKPRHPSKCFCDRHVRSNEPEGNDFLFQRGSAEFAFENNFVTVSKLLMSREEHPTIFVNVPSAAKCLE